MGGWASVKRATRLRCPLNAQQKHTPQPLDRGCSSPFLPPLRPRDLALLPARSTRPFSSPIARDQVTKALKGCAPTALCPSGSWAGPSYNARPIGPARALFSSLRGCDRTHMLAAGRGALLCGAEARCLSAALALLTRHAGLLASGPRLLPECAGPLAQTLHTLAAKGSPAGGEAVYSSPLQRVRASSGGSPAAPQQLTNLRHFLTSAVWRQDASGGSGSGGLGARVAEQMRSFHQNDRGLRAGMGMGIVEQLHDDPTIHLPVAGTRNLWEVRAGEECRQRSFASARAAWHPACWWRAPCRRQGMLPGGLPTPRACPRCAHVIVSPTNPCCHRQVLEFHPDATVLETCKTPEVLNLHPRGGCPPLSRSPRLQPVVLQPCNCIHCNRRHGNCIHCIAATLSISAHRCTL